MKQHTEQVKSINAVSIGATLEVTLIPSRRGGLQTDVRIDGRRAFVVEDQKTRWAQPGEVWRVKIISENEVQTVYFVQLLSRLRKNEAGPLSDLRKLAQAAAEHFNAGRFAEAAPIYREALEKHPEEAFLAFRLAKCFVELHLPGDAIDLYEQLSMHYLETVSELTGKPFDEIEKG